MAFWGFIFIIFYFLLCVLCIIWILDEWTDDHLDYKRFDILKSLKTGYNWFKLNN